MWLPKTLLITDGNLGMAACERMSKVANDVTWFSWDFDEQVRREEILRQIRLCHWDLAISFYSDLIITPAELGMIGLPLNIHPALPTIRGVGHDIIPLVEEHSTVGATLHRMEPIVDSGEIYDVLEAPIHRRQTYESLRAFNQSLCLEMLDRLCKILAATPDLGMLEQELRARAANVRHRWGTYHSRIKIDEFKESIL